MSHAIDGALHALTATLAAGLLAGLLWFVPLSAPPVTQEANLVQVTSTATPPADITVSGLVYDSAIGETEPLAGARVELLACARTLTTQTGADGRYSLTAPGTDLTCETVTLRAWASGHERLARTLSVAELTAQPEQSFGLAPGLVLTGQIVNSATVPRQPIGGARVSIAVCTPRTFEAVTEANGSYFLFVPEAYLCNGMTVRATGNGFVSSPAVPIGPAPGDYVRNFSLSPLPTPMPSPTPTAPTEYRLFLPHLTRQIERR